MPSWQEELKLQLIFLQKSKEELTTHQPFVEPEKKGLDEQ